MAADAGVQIEWVELDIADSDSVKNGFARIFEQTETVDVLVNNAGVGGNAVVEESPPELFLDVMNINLCGAVRCIQEVAPGMRERKTGCIVNVSSVVGRFAALAQAPYVASKWALEAISEELAQELAPFGIRVAIIEPGITKSAIFAKNVDAPNSSGAYDTHYRRMFQFYAAGASAWTTVTGEDLVRHVLALPQGQEGHVHTDRTMPVMEHPELAAAIKSRRK